MQIFKRVFALVVLATHATLSWAHGYLAVPEARNLLRPNEYCPHCLSGPKPCGDIKYNTYETSTRIAESYKAGGTLTAKVIFTANHKGRWALSVCNPRGKSGVISRKCFVPLYLTQRGKGRFVYVSSSDSHMTAKFKLPKTLACDPCILRWRYVTGNSCNPRGTPYEYRTHGLDVCGKWMNPEEFNNCADIRVT